MNIYPYCLPTGIKSAWVKTGFSQIYNQSPLSLCRGRDGQLYDGPLAMELGELTGQFTSRVEQVVSVLQKILHKMELTRHELSTREQFQELDQELFHLRHDFLMKAANIPAGRLVHHSHSVHVMNSGAQRNILGIIRALGKDYADSTKDIFRLWDTFILIFDYFLDVQKDNMKDFEDLGRKVKDRQVKLLVAQAEPSERVQEKWQQVVTALSSGLAPYCKLLEIVLGNLQQKCSVCMVNIKIESTFGDHPSGSLKERKPVAICQGQLTKFHCGKEKCRTDVREMHVKDQVAIMQYVMKAIKEHRKDRCDWCNTLKRVVHRCSKCLTKVYCSEECHDLDWEKVHKDICREKSDIRKLKMSRKSRVMEDSELPETITLKDGRVMVKISGETQRVITCPAAPCPDPQEDLVGFYRHELILYIPWGAPGQPNFLKMSDSDIVKFYTRKKKDIEIVRRKLEADGSSDDSSAASFKHVNKRGQQVVYAD